MILISKSLKSTLIQGVVMLSVFLYLPLCYGDSVQGNSLGSNPSQAQPSQAAKPIYPFESEAKSTRFAHLLTQYRCLVCQNQNLADSNAPLAQDLRQIIYDQIKVNQSDADIQAYLVSRYGEFVLYNPKLQSSTYLLWFGPVLFLLIGFGVLWRVVKKQQASTGDIYP